ncbi:hypothetical protein SLEP1_g36061 [Rubroshorea leprosula]|uniref:RNA-directed DNA polymerase n=1 Tax=Rubroshorea leprosula TaxID=152421 RepID=A0AAV5KQJ7_9ROSI|nr:hypothetical protein SLEP1_g36061 [Rubroshorea leprosula]
MAMGKILSRLIPDDPLIPLLNRGEQPATVVATCNSLALSNVVVPTRPRGSGKLNPEPSLSKHNEELLKKNTDLERHLKDVQKSIDKLRSPKSRQKALNLDSAPLNLSITVELYQEGFKIPHLETYDGSGDPDEHLHTYQAIMRIQNATNAMMCKVFPAMLKSTARRWYHKLPRHSIASYSKLATLFSNKFASQREIKHIATELLQVHQKEGESLRDYMQRFNKSTLDIDNVLDTISLSASFILSEDFQSSKQRADDRQSKSHEQPQRREERKKQKVSEQWGKPSDFPKYANYIPLTSPRGMTSLKGKGISSATARMCIRITNILPSKAERTRDVSSIGGQSARGRKAYACQVMIVNKNKPLKRPFEEAKWENATITFSSADYKQTEEEPDVMMPHVDPFVAAIHIGNHNVNKVSIDTGSSPDILYWSCFQKMQLNPNSLQKYEGPIYGFDNQPVPVEEVITLPIYVGFELHLRMASVSFLVVKMESTFNAILGRATLCELKAVISQAVISQAVISQPHLCMKFPTPQGVGVLKGEPEDDQSLLSRYIQEDIEHRPQGVKQKAEPIEPVEVVPLNPNMSERTVKVGTKLTAKERAELLEFLKVNQDVFAWTTDEMPGIPTELAVHKLSTDPTRRPMVQKHRLFGPEKQAAIDEEIQKLLQAGFIKRVEYSMWVSNPVLVKKPNGKWRMCIDFTNLNKTCPKDPHPLPNVEKLVQLLLDDQKKTAFYAGDAIYCYVMMPFGLKNAGVTYQKLVQVIFKLQIGRNIEVYVDNMIVTSKRAEDHIDDLNETFQNLRRAQMKLNPLKCTFVVESGKSLGYVVSKKRIEVNPEKVQAVQQMELSKTIKDVHLLTGRVAALHRFIVKSAERCLPFFKALRELKNFQWTDECQQAFDELKQYLASAPLLSKPVEGESLYLYLGVTEEVGTKQNYPLAEKAAFALAYTARKLRAYFQSHKIVIYIDLSLRKILQKSELSSRLIGWTVELSEYDLKFQPHTTIKGRLGFLRTHPGAGFASGFAPNPACLGLVEPNTLGFGSFRTQRLGSQGTQACWVRKEPKCARFASGFLQTMTISDIEHRPQGVEQKAEPIEPVEVNQDVFAWMTDEMPGIPTELAVHKLNTDPTRRPVVQKRRLFGPKKQAAIDEEIQKLLQAGFIRRVEYSEWMKKARQGSCWVIVGVGFDAGFDFSISNARILQVLGSFGLDLLDPFVKSRGGCTYLVVAVDYFTKWIEAKPLSTTTEKKIEEFLFNSILCRFSIPKRIITDNGPQFRAVALRMFCNDYGIELALTSATGETPFSLAYGAEAVIPVEIGLPFDRSDQHNDPSNEQLLRENLDPVEEVREMSRIRNIAHQSHVARFYNKRVRTRQFQIGDLVLRKAGLTNTYSHMGKLAPN